MQIHRSERTDALVAGLAELLSTSPADPFVPDIVAVPTKGVERWIAQSLSTTLGIGPGGRDGVCANVLFPSPGRLVREAVTAGTGIAPDEDPWAEHRLSWALLDVVDDCAGEDWCVTLGRHLGTVEGVDQGRRMAVAQKLAGLFTSYAAQRPAMLVAWAEGHDTDGAGGPLDDDHRWQAELWRRLRTVVGQESPGERMAAACARLRKDPALVDLPERLSLFGPTRLTTAQLQVIDALAEHRDVHLWLPHPSPGLWQRVGEAAPVGPTLRRNDPTIEVPHHPLIRSLARDARELQMRLATQTSPTSDEHLGAETPADSLLHALQRDLHRDAVPSGEFALPVSDRSIEVHACHGRHRQVEVLRERILGLLADDPTLQLRDIIVMCPDIESYAPLISATFGLAADEDAEEDFPLAHPGQRLTVRLADRSLRQTNPVLDVAARLLELVDARLTVSEVLDLAAMAPVRARFGFDDDELERLGDWLGRAGVRWGLDGAFRRRYGLDLPQNTWRVGLDRLMLGITMSEDELRPLGLALPLDDVDSSEIDLAGRFAELVDRLSAVVGRLSGQQPLEAWVDALADAVDSFVEVPVTEAWQLNQARWQLTDALVSAGERSGTLLGLADVRTLLADRLQGRPSRANFRTGHLTLCTMVPMRSVPHQVVCLLGLDDGVFPRSTRVDGDDVLARDPWVGERDARAEDRQLFLDAILSARERLIVLYTGADERTGALRPPAVPLGELLDLLDRTADASVGAVRDQIVVRHPLQPFDARNFAVDELGDGLFSFDRAAYDGSTALLTPRASRPPFLERPLPPVSDDQQAGEDGIVELEALIRFLEHPVKQFLSQRLGLSTPYEEDETPEGLPVDLDGLEKWAIGDRLLEAGLAGIDADVAKHAEWLRGQLPPGRLGAAVIEPVVAEVAVLVNRSAGLRAEPRRQLDVAIDLGDAVLAGTVPGVHGSRVVRVVYSRLAPKHRIRSWVHLLALAAQFPDEAWEAATVGRGQGGVVLSRLRGVDADQARGHLAELVGLYREGLCRPLPIPPATAHGYAERRHRNIGPRASETYAGRAWRSGSGQRQFGDFDDVHHRTVWGEAELAALLAQPPDPADPDWPEEPHRFGQLARRVWSPLLAAEEMHQG